jgi:hypothetical protein
MMTNPAAEQCLPNALRMECQQAHQVYPRFTMLLASPRPLSFPKAGRVSYSFRFLPNARPAWPVSLQVHPYLPPHQNHITLQSMPATPYQTREDTGKPHLTARVRYSVYRRILVWGKRTMASAWSDWYRSTPDMLHSGLASP